jgi:hypothetical protein
MWMRPAEATLTVRVEAERDASTYSKPNLDLRPQDQGNLVYA